MKNKLKRCAPSFIANVAFNLLSLAGPLLFAFVATPLLVRGLGVEDYGYYSLVLAVIGFGFTTGIGRLPAKYIPDKRASNKSHELPQLLSSTILITLGVAVVESLILALATTFLVSQILNVPEMFGGQLRSAIYIACLIGPAMMLSQVFQSALQGIHRFRAFSVITITASFFLNLGSVLLAVNEFPYADIFIWNMFVTTIAGITFFAFARSEITELRIQTTHDREILRTVSRFAASIFIYQSVTSIFYLFERAYILRNFGAEALTYYTIPLMLGIYLHGLVLGVSQVAIPKFNERVSDPESLIGIYRTLTKLVVAVAAFLALMYFSVGEELLTLWLGPDFAARSFRLLVIDGAAFGAIALLIPAWILSESAQRPGMNASSPIVTYVVGMAAIVFLGSIYQTEGVAGGRLFGALVSIPLIFIVEYQVFRQISWRFWFLVIARVTGASIVLTLIDVFVLAPHLTSWPAFLAGSIVLTAAFWASLIASGYLSRSELRSAFSQQFEREQGSEIIGAMP